MESVCAQHRASRGRRVRRRCGASLALLSLVALAALVPGASAQPGGGASLHLGSMTFVSTRGEENEMVLRADKAHMPPGAEVAHLEGVHVVMHNPGGARKSFEMTCLRGDLQLESADFHAEGEVEARMADGRRIFTPSLDYDSDRGLVTSDAPVRIREGGHTMRGRGFRYNVKNGHFVLRGGASVVQE